MLFLTKVPKYVICILKNQLLVIFSMKSVTNFSIIFTKKSPSLTQALDIGRGFKPSAVFSSILRICIHLIATKWC